MMARHGMSAREAIKLAMQLGAQVEYPGGEFMFLFPGMKAMRGNYRRKDVSRAVSAWLMKLEKSQGNQPQLKETGS